MTRSACAFRCCVRTSTVLVGGTAMCVFAFFFPTILAVNQSPDPEKCPTSLRERPHRPHRLQYNVPYQPCLHRYHRPCIGEWCTFGCADRNSLWSGQSPVG